MTKYYNTMVVFQEIPNEITLAINVTNCPCKCPSCHSKFLWGDVGIELTEDELSRLLEKNRGITCVCFMGGDANPSDINSLAQYVKYNYGIKVGWYSGRDELSDDIDLNNFDFVKIGRYDEAYGPLNKETTNQRMYIVNGDKSLSDITNTFWRRSKAV